MGKRLQTIYEYFSDYTEKEIDDMIYSLSIEEKLVIRDRYGDDLHNPNPTDKWNKERSKEFYGSVLPKMKRLLAKGKNNPKVIDSTENTEQSSVIEVVLPKIEIVDEMDLLLQLLKEGKSNTEICECLNINIQQLHGILSNLKNRGIMYLRKYYSDGSIRHKAISNMQDLKKVKRSGIDQDTTIITDSKENSLKLLVMSDLHIGNELERIDLINRAYNYCVKNGINIILCGGDIIDGSYSKGNQKITNLYEQLEYFIKNYPYDKNILTFAVAGDHDISAFYKSSIDIIEMCSNFRQDIVIGGYNNTNINIKNDKIHLHHHVDAGMMFKTDAPIILNGHYHKFSTEMKNNALNVLLPSLSDILHLMPSVLELNLYFDKGYIESTVIKHIYFGEQDVILGEFTFDLLKGRTINYEPIKNIEPYKSQIDEPKVLKKVNEPLSQIEKFNRRYGL